MEAITEGKWDGLPNYICTKCSRSDLDKDNLLHFQATSCKKPDCPGRPYVEEPKPTAAARAARAPRPSEPAEALADAVRATNGLTETVRKGKAAPKKKRSTQEVKKNG